MKKRILITGASGFLGDYLVKKCLQNPDYELIGTYCRQQPDFAHPNLRWGFLNLLELDTLPAFLASVGKIDAVLHCAGIANLGFCEKFPALSHRLNVYASTALAQATQTAQIPFIFTSTDMVFNGSNPPYSETDFPHPLSQYGKQKQAAEEALLTDFDHTLVCRLPLLFGQGWGQNFMQKLSEDLSNQRPTVGFEDEFRTPLSGAEAAKGVCMLLHWAFSVYKKHPNTWEMGRLLHLAGGERINRYELAAKIAGFLNCPTQSLQKGQRTEIETGYLRPADVSLSAGLAKELLGFESSSVQNQLQNLGS